MIALIDYRAGNLASVRKAFAAVGADLFTPATPDDLRNARAVVVPGVGHFLATAVLDDAWRRAILASVDRGRPLLGICLGLQWLFEGSEEAPDQPGLGLLEGWCHLLSPGPAAPGGESRAPRAADGAAQARSPKPDAGSPEAPAMSRGNQAEGDGPAPFRATGTASQEPSRIKIPHVGWNALEQVRRSRLLDGVADGAQAYFTHSYVAPITEACVAATTHGERFASVVERGLVYGAQFHPEKSAEVGLRMLRNFLAAAGDLG